MHVTPNNPRSTSCKHCTVCPQHSIVHNLAIIHKLTSESTSSTFIWFVNGTLHHIKHLLSLGELSIDRPTTSNIRAVAAVLRPKVKEHHVSILDCLVVGSSSVTIMQNSSACSSCCYAVVAHMPEHRQRLGRLAKLLQQEMNLHYMHLAPP